MNLQALRRDDLRQVSRLHRRHTPGWERARTGFVGSPLVLVPAAAGVVTLVLRLLYAAHSPTDWDGVQMTIGAGHFDVTHGAPHPPGYWLYVMAGHALHAVTGLSTVSSLVLLSALASAAGAAMTCAAGAAIGGWWLGVAAAALVALAPVSWFDVSTVSTYGFDALVAALLVVIAVRARPGTRHGVGAAMTLGLGAGFRPSVLPMFLLLALVAVLASDRTVRRWAVTLVAAMAAVAVWFVPMVVEQPGGVQAWWHATRAETSGATHVSSIFYNPAGAATNFGAFAAFTVLTLGPAFVLGIVAGVSLLGARLVTRRGAGDAGLRIWSDARAGVAAQERPWYQTTPAVLAAAIVPPLAVVNLSQFAKGGYVLSYLPAATVALLLPVGRLVRHRARALRRAALAVFTLGVVGACLVDAQRFVSAPGILPVGFAASHRGLWISQARYQAPYTDTADTIRAADAVDAALPRLAPVVRPEVDVVVMLWSGQGATYFRQLTYALPRVPAVLVLGATVVYAERDGLLYYRRDHSVVVGEGGHAVFLVPGPPPVLLALEHAGTASPAGVTVAGLQAWRVSPGTSLLGVTVSEKRGPRPLGGHL